MKFLFFVGHFYPPASDPDWPDWIRIKSGSGTLVPVPLVTSVLFQRVLCSAYCVRLILKITNKCCFAKVQLSFFFLHKQIYMSDYPTHMFLGEISPLFHFKIYRSCWHPIWMYCILYNAHYFAYHIDPAFLLGCLTRLRFSNWSVPYIFFQRVGIVN